MPVAYIIDQEKTSDEVICWKLVFDPLTIVESPVHGTYIVNDDQLDQRRRMKPEEYENICRKIEEDYPAQDKLYYKYAEIFQLRTKNSRLGNYSNPQTINLSLTPILKYLHYIFQEEEIYNQFINYIKEKKSIDVPHIRDIGKSNRKKLNESGIFIRPTLKKLEYNPKRAAIQLNRLKSKKSTSKSRKVKLTRNMLNALYNGLHYIISTATSLYIDPVYPLKGRTKFTTAKRVVVYIDLYNLFIAGNSYRHLNSFHEVLCAWKKMNKMEKQEFPNQFIVFMNKEARAPQPSKDELRNHYDHKKDGSIVTKNKEIFKHSKHLH